MMLSGCGFHFRDAQNTAPHVKFLGIQDNSGSRTGLVFVLRQNLQAVGVTPTTKPQQSPLTLVILSDNFTQGITALGTAQQLNAEVLMYSVTVTLRNTKGINITPPTTLSAQITFWQNANQILGDSTAIPALKQNMIREMSQKILAFIRANDTHD